MDGAVVQSFRLCTRSLVVLEEQASPSSFTSAKYSWLKYGQQMHNLVTCAVAAPTGIAAFNVGGVNIYLFQLLIEHEGQTTGYWSLPKASQKITRTTFQQVKLFTFDEVSMISNLNLAYLHLCLEEVFGIDKWCGSMNIFFVGDLLPLPPPGVPVFEGLTNKLFTHTLDV